MFDEARQEIIDQLRNGATLRVFLALPDHLSWTEFRPLNQSQLATRLKITGASVSRAMKDLLNRGIVERIGAGPVMQWKLSLKWGWRGNAAAYHAAMRETGEQHRTLKKPERPALNAAEDILC
jgi:DNA-binding IclR family transcriptional regulator